MMKRTMPLVLALLVLACIGATNDNYGPITVYHPLCKVQFTISTNVTTRWVTVQDTPPQNVGNLTVMVYGYRKEVGFITTNLLSVVEYYDGTNILSRTQHIIKLIGEDEWPSQKRTVSYSNADLIQQYTK